MDCDTYHELIVADLDDTLSASEQEAVREHLDGCARCRKARALEAEFAAHLRRGPRLVETPAAVQARLRDALTRATPSPGPGIHAEDYDLAADAHLPLDLTTSDPAELTRYLDDSGRCTFAASVLDLRAAGYRLLGGAIRERHGVVFAVSVYERDGEVVTCHRFVDPEGDPGSEIATRRYQRSGDLGTWMTRHDGVVCCLTGRKSPEELEHMLSLARV